VARDSVCRVTELSVRAYTYTLSGVESRGGKCEIFEIVSRSPRAGAAKVAEEGFCYDTRRREVVERSCLYEVRADDKNLSSY